MLSEPAIATLGPRSLPGDTGILGEDGQFGEGVLAGEGIVRALRNEGGRRKADDSAFWGVGVCVGVGESTENLMVAAGSGVGCAQRSVRSVSPHSDEGVKMGLLFEGVSLWLEVDCISLV